MSSRPWADTPSSIGSPASPSGQPTDVALDSNGNLFVSDHSSAVYEVLAAGGYTTVNRLASGFTFGQPSGLAVDGNGNVFLSDAGNVAIYEILAAGGYTTVNQLASGFAFKSPLGVSVDTAGNVFVADGNFTTVFEILPTDGYTQVVPLGTGLGSPWSITVGANGNVYVPDVGIEGAMPPSIQLIQRSQPPSFSFASTAVGSTSTDSPQSVVIQNTGNQPLDAIAPGLLVTGPNFVQVPGSGTPRGLHQQLHADAGRNLQSQPQFRAAECRPAHQHRRLYRQRAQRQPGHPVDRAQRHRHKCPVDQEKGKASHHISAVSQYHRLP